MTERRGATQTMNHDPGQHDLLPRGGLARRLSGVCAAAVLVLATGCGTKGPDVQFVEGRVTLDGAPLANATVGYTSAEATGLPPAYGVTDESGVYRLTSIGGRHGRGAMVGTFVVTVMKYESEEVPENDPRQTPPKVWSVVPLFYGDVSTSPLRATVAEGANTGAAFDFDLPSKPAKKP
jgi:hypothetical protein